MQIKILDPGLLTTIQDLGRPLFRSQAVPCSGAMDSLSARLANKALGNCDNAAVIEFTYGNSSFFCANDLLTAYTGGGADLTVNGVLLPSYRPVFIPSGSVVKLIENQSGTRCYLAVAGGWEVPEVLGSRSTYLAAGFGGFEGRILKKNDIIHACSEEQQTAKTLINNLSGGEINYPKWSIARSGFMIRKEVRVVPGQEFLWFDAVSIINLLSRPFITGVKGNRMGIHFDGPFMQRRKNDELLSTAVTMGTIQVTGEGKLILLMADAQTTGGYPRIAQVAAVDLFICAQLRPHEEIYFKEISSEEAERLYLERENQLRELNATIALKYLNT